MTKSLLNNDLRHLLQMAARAESMGHGSRSNTPKSSGSQEKPKKTTYFIRSATDRFFLFFSVLGLQTARLHPPPHLLADPLLLAEHVVGVLEVQQQRRLARKDLSGHAGDPPALLLAAEDPDGLVGLGLPLLIEIGPGAGDPAPRRR